MHGGTTAATESRSFGRRVWTKLKRWLLTGLILVAPAFITAIALRWLFSHIDTPVRRAIAGLTGYSIPGVGVVVLVVLLTATGAVASTLVLRRLLRWFEATLDRIPLVRTLYSGVKQLIAPLADDSGTGFQKVVLIRYPDQHLYALGFLIRRDAARTPDGEELAAVLVPTNHLHLGSVVLCPESRIHEVDMDAEQGLRFLVSMGAALDRRLAIRPAAPALGARP